MHHQCNGHELGQTSGDGEGQRGLACCSPWGHKEADATGQLNSTISILENTRHSNIEMFILNSRPSLTLLPHFELSFSLPKPLKYNLTNITSKLISFLQQYSTYLDTCSHMLLPYVA